MVQLHEQDLLPRMPGTAAAGPAPALDVRLHTPRAEVVVVQVSGAVDERSAGLLGERIVQQLARATHVVVDLAEVPVLRNCGMQVLADVHRQATRCGTCLHITGVEDATVCDLLRAADLDIAPCAEGVIALLPARLPRRRPAHHS